MGVLKPYLETVAIQSHKEKTCSAARSVFKEASASRVAK
jgi:hypothetical protein